MFRDVTLVSNAKIKIMQIKQGNKTAAEHTTEFKHYAVVLTEFNELALFWTHRNNINTTRLQDELIIFRDTSSTLQEYHDLVINLDLLMKEEKINKDRRNIDKNKKFKKPVHFHKPPTTAQQHNHNNHHHHQCIISILL